MVNAISGFYSSVGLFGMFFTPKPKKSETCDLKTLWDKSISISPLYPHVREGEFSDGLPFIIKAEHPTEKGILAREVHALRRLKHKNIISLLDTSPQARPEYMVLPKLYGKDIFDCINQKDPLPVKRIFNELLEAVDFVARSQFVHSDVTVYNVFYTPGEPGHATLFDFGAAGMIGSKTAQIPSLPLSAPEQSLLLPLDPKSDIWGVAVVIVSILQEYSHFYTDPEQYSQALHMWAVGKRIGSTTVGDVILDLIKRNKGGNLPGEVWRQYLTLLEGGKAPINVEPIPFERYTEGALLKKMLEPDPSKRISAEEALKHPYFTEA